MKQRALFQKLYALLEEYVYRGYLNDIYDIDPIMDICRVASEHGDIENLKWLINHFNVDDKVLDIALSKKYYEVLLLFSYSSDICPIDTP